MRPAPLRHFLAVERFGHALRARPVPERHVPGEMLSSLLTSWIFEAEIAQPLFSGGSPPGCRVSERPRLFDGGHDSVFVDLFLAKHLEKRRPIEICGLTHEPCVEWAGGRYPGLREAAQQDVGPFGTGRIGLSAPEPVV